METKTSQTSSLIRKAAAVGLKVLPLAVMAVQLAHATPSTYYTFSGGTATAGCTSTEDCRLTSGSFTSNAPAYLGSTLSLGVTSTTLLSYSGGASPLVLTWYGAFAPSGLPSGTYGFSYLFTLSDNNGVPLNWDLQLSGNLVGESSGTSTQPKGQNVDVSGSGTATTNSGSSFETITLTVWWGDATINGGDSFTVNVPYATSIDIPLTATSSVPEPAAALLVAPALGALALLRRRKSPTI